MARYRDKDSGLGAFILFVVIPFLILGAIWLTYKIYRACFEFFDHVFSSELSEITHKFFSGLITLLPIAATYFIWIADTKPLTPIWLLYSYIAGVFCVMFICYIPVMRRKKSEPSYISLLETEENNQNLIEATEEFNDPEPEPEPEPLPGPVDETITEEKPEPAIKPAAQKGRVLDF